MAFAQKSILIILAPVFKELQNCARYDKKNGAPHFPKFHEKKGNRFSIAELPGDMELPTDSKSHQKKKAHTVTAGRNKIRKMLEKTRFSILPPRPFRYGLSFQNIISFFNLVYFKRLRSIVNSIYIVLCFT